MKSEPDRIPVIQGGDVSLCPLPPMVGASHQDARAATHLSLLNALLMVSLEDIPLEAQLLCALDLLSTLPWSGAEPPAAVFLTGDDPEFFTLVAARGLSDDMRARGGRVPASHCFCGRPAADAGVVAIHDAGDRHDGHYDHARLAAHCTLPLRRNGRVLGMLVLGTRAGYSCDPVDTEFLNVVSGMLVAIVSHGRAAEHIRRLLDENRQFNRRLIALQEQEYRRISRELHDEIGQSVAVIKTEAVLLTQARGAGDLQCATEAIDAEADRIHDTVRAMVRRLRPGALDDLGLVAAIEGQVADWHRRRPALPCRFTLAGKLDDLDDQINIALYRLAQECLTNVSRHSAATEVDMQLVREAPADGPRSRGTVIFRVRDNGRGMDLGRARESDDSFGLLGMRERVEGLGGTLAIEAAPGQGFSVTAIIPVAERRRSQGL